MMQLDETFLCGSYPPLVTPFRGGKVDFDRFADLAERQAKEGSHGLVVAGTTGEPSSLTVAERTELVKVAVAAVRGRIPVVAATGSQSFAETVELTQQGEKAGASAVLVVTPYYIKPSQRGLIEYFAAVGKRTALPLMIYHIPGRAAVSIHAKTVMQIGERIDNLVGLKHADKGLELLTELQIGMGPEFRMFCGLEALSLPMLVLGASGLMNAVGNVAPAKVASLYTAVKQGDLQMAQRLHLELFELNRAIFFDTNPVPLKYMMSRLGMLDSPDLDAELQKAIDPVLLRAGLLQPSEMATD
jgi:4-hydroxy-tetrahydrodipicolinate synthase